MTTTSPIYLSLGDLTRADGSAIAATGNSAVQVAVHGPGDVPLHKEQLEEATIDVVFKDAARSKDLTPDDKELQAFVRGVVQSVIRVDLYPKTLIQIVVQELETDGHLLSLSLNCICAALLDSGLALKCTFAAVTVATDASGTMVADTADQSSFCRSRLTTVYDSCSKQILALHQEGCPLSRAVLQECLQCSRRQCDRVLQSLESAVRPES